MKYPLVAVFALLTAAEAGAQNYRVVYSPSLQLEIYIDNLKDQNPASWCAPQLPLRIVAGGDKQPEVLQDFLPRVGNLLGQQCASLNQLDWQMNDSAGNPLARGNAAKMDNWAPKLNGGDDPRTLSKAPELSPAADTTPWLQFSLIEGCHFRGYWGTDSRASALFVPAKQGTKCGDDGWLSGQSQITQVLPGATRNISITFLQGFPVAGLNGAAAESPLQITTVNNQRMVLSDAGAPQSWMILPYAAQLNGWQSDGTVAVQLAQSDAADEDQLQARLEAVRKVWSSYLLADGPLTILLVDALQPQLKDPAAGAWRSIK
ncbi:hypothetical protein [Pantoea sp. B65]|uniref:hypothetical protein n=1 Tax=Pantoea sp. B65 TaxID=2813359 RepID=UPI0039B46E45